MKGKMFKELVANIPDDSEVVMNDIYGDRALFVLQYANDYLPIVIAGKDDCDMTEELRARFENASKSDMDELDFFTDLVDTGFDLDDIKEYLPDRYEYSREFMTSHGLA